MVQADPAPQLVPALVPRLEQGRLLGLPGLRPVRCHRPFATILPPNRATDDQQAERDQLHSGRDVDPAAFAEEGSRVVFVCG
jgi:hypothetical protein